MSVMSHFRGSVIEKKVITPSVLLVRLRLNDRRLKYNPGQYAMLGVPLSDGTSIERPYSIASTAQAKDLEFLVQLKKGSAVPEYFNSAPIGSPVTIRGPLGGTFHLPAKNRRLHFIAAGCGIAPFRALMQDLFKTNPRSSVRFSFLREPHSWGVIDDELAQWYHRCQNFSYSIIHMRSIEASKIPWRWRHVDIGEPTHGELFYLAGGSGFVTNLKAHLLENGFKTRNIITESS